MYQQVPKTPSSPFRVPNTPSPDSPGTFPKADLCPSLKSQPSFKARQKPLFLEALVSPGRIHLSLQQLALLDTFCAPLLLSLAIVSPHEDIHSVRAGMASPALAQNRPPVTLNDQTIS